MIQDEEQQTTTIMSIKPKRTAAIPAGDSWSSFTGGVLAPTIQQW